VNVVGALLIAAGLGLIVAEVFVTSYGLLAVAGIVGFVFGSLMLVDTPVPELRIGLEVALPAAAVLAGLTLVLVLRAVRSRRMRLQSGIETLPGASAEVIDDIAPGRDGKVFVQGAYWTATAAQPLPAGARVRVEAVDGLRLRVAPAAATEQRGDSS
jgi:membrane-bound serine protease (ClpP class)